MDVRGYRSEDADGVIAFFADSTRADPTLVPPSADEWRSFTAQSFNRGARDFLVAEEDGRVFAVANSTRGVERGRTLRHFRIFVHPERRRQGIGAAIYDRIAAQDPDGAATLQCGTPDDWAAGRAFLAERGFRRERLCRFMRIDDAPTDGTPDAHADVELREDGRTAEESAAWQRLNDEGYAGEPDYAALSESDLVALRAEPGFRMLFAHSSGDVVGLCHVKEFGSEPWINSVVVTPGLRRRGIARAMMLRTMQLEARRPLRLSVLDENPNALRLYEELGFRTERTETTWWREPSERE